MEKIMVDWENCDYCRTSYYEHDTGCSEYECELTGSECMKKCPLCFKYNIVNEKEAPIEETN